MMIGKRDHAALEKSIRIFEALYDAVVDLGYDGSLDTTDLENMLGDYEDAINQVIEGRETFAAQRMGR